MSTDYSESDSILITPHIADLINMSSTKFYPHVTKVPNAEESESNPINITVTYSLWVGSNISEKYSLNVTVDHNETFYEIMQRAAEMDSKYT